MRPDTTVLLAAPRDTRIIVTQDIIALKKVPFISNAMLATIARFKDSPSPVVNVKLAITVLLYRQTHAAACVLPDTIALKDLVPCLIVLLEHMALLLELPRSKIVSHAKWGKVVQLLDFLHPALPAQQDITAL